MNRRRALRPNDKAGGHVDVVSIEERTTGS